MTSWIFQGNPKMFRINDYLLSREIILWDIRQEYFAKKINIGDNVYIWRSNDNQIQGGIIAVGTIISLPGDFPDDAIGYWMVQHKKSTRLRVKIRLVEVRIDEKGGMLIRSKLAQDPSLAHMRILSYFAQTNYMLDDNHAQRIRDIWADHKKTETINPR